MKKVRLYDNTRLDGARSCMRYFYFRHVRHWTEEKKSAALGFGGGWGHALDVIWRRYRDLKSKTTRRETIEEAYQAFVAKWVEEGFPHPDEMSPEDIDDIIPRTPMIAQEMLYNYIDERMHIFEAPSFELLHIERPFCIPMSPTDDTLFYVGRMDKEIRYQKQRIGIDHKSSSMYRKNGPFRSEWVDSWELNAQMDGYLFELRMEFPNEKNPAVWVDGALVHKTEHDGFIFIPIQHKAEHLEGWLYDTHSWIANIEANKAVVAERSATDTPYLAAFPKNTKSCLNYGRCPYFDICASVPNPAKLKEPPLGFRYDRWSPFKEIKLQEIGFSEESSE